MADVKHFDYIDIAKGFGIILVVMGHTMFPFHPAIDVFHMPLFFFISGLTLRQYEDYTVFFVNKVNRILIPYLFFSIVLSIINFFHPLLGDYTGPMWFLVTLFATLIVIEALLEKGRYVQIGFVAACVLISFLLNHFHLTLLPFDLDRVFRSAVFVYAGYWLASSNVWHCLLSRMQCRNKKWLTVLGLGGLSCCIYSLGILTMTHYYIIADGEGFKVGEMFGRSVILLYLTSFSGILTLLLCSMIIKSKILKWLGTNSLIILCVHFPFTQYWNQFIANTALYQSGGGKLLCAILSYIVILTFCFPFILLCKKYLPSLTGYKSLLRITSSKQSLNKY